MSAQKIVPFRPRKHPRTFTSAEQVIDRVRVAIFESGMSYKAIGQGAGRSGTTIRKLACGDTKWPSQQTLFGVMATLGLGIQVVNLGKE